MLAAMLRYTTKMSPDEKPPSANDLRKEGNLCIGAGAGVGALGIASAVAVGAVCPLCYVVPPALIGIGAFRRWQADRVRLSEQPPQPVADPKT